MKLLALYCVLLVSAASLVERSQARAVDVQPLAAAAASPVEEGQRQAASEQGVEKKEPVHAAAEDDKQVVGKAAAANAERSPKADDGPAEGQKLSPSSIDAKASRVQPSSGEKDIKSLLESKNDAENDLAAGAESKVGPGAASGPESPLVGKKVADELDAPVEATLGGKPQSDDRFHYSFSSGSSSSSEKAGENEEEDEAEEGESGQPEAKKDEPALELSPTVAPPSVTSAESTSSAPPSSSSEQPNSSPKPSETLAPSSSIAEASSAAPASSAGPDSDKSSEQKPGEPKLAPAPEIEKAAKAEVPSVKADASGEPAGQAIAVAPKQGDVTAKKDDGSSLVRPELSDSAGSKAESSSDTVVISDDKKIEQPQATAAATTTTTSTSVAPANEQGAKAGDDKAAKPATSSETPVEKPGPLAASADPIVAPVATAAASAAGSALGTALANGISNSLSGKASTTSTQAPSIASSVPSETSSASTTTSSTTTSTSRPSLKKSTTDRWNRWQPTGGAPSSGGASSTSTPPPPPSSSSTPSSRRRPILPSIRRRFRPYNRFSPFPWTGPEPYTPLGSEAASGEQPANETPSSPHGFQTLKPRRGSGQQPASGAGHEQPVTRSQPGPWSAADPESDLEPSNARPANPRRRPQHNNRRNHHHHHHHRHHQAEAAPDFGTGSSRRRHQQPGRHHQHHRDQDYRPGHSFAGFPSDSPFNLRPSAFGSPLTPIGGFGLFNSAASSSIPSSASSGFDLLNPFTWIDEVTKPARPQHNRPTLLGGSGSGRQPPGAYEGEYPPAGRPSSHSRPTPTGGRDDYYDDHHCHEHDYEHRPGRRPSRPGDYDRPASGYDRPDYDRPGYDRPDRPSYDRPDRPGYDRPDRPGYDRPTYGGRRPERPYRRGEDEPSTPVTRSHAPEVEQSSPNASAPEQQAGDRPPIGSNERVSNSPTQREDIPARDSQPRRISSSFSPFDSLFGPIEDELFGGAAGLRSSFFETPLKAAADAIRQTNTALDTIVTSPKIAIPTASAS